MKFAASKTLSVATKLIPVAAIPLLIIFWDGVLPSSKQEVHVLYVDEASSEVRYVIPLSGGGVGSCTASPEVLNALQPTDSAVIYESALFSSCSAHVPDWPVDIDLHLQRAISFAYQDRYQTLNELMQDFPGFVPKLRLWEKEHWFLPESSRRYSVQMPKELVIFNTEGKALFAARCGTEGGYCETVSPISAPASAQGHQHE
ncbi:hypothetical protein ACTXGQ_33855 [Marinobacter sp. 1Y8]